MKTLTVFTPTYNRRHTLWRTYESLLRQTSKDFDWLVIDDGSTDGTREWVEGLGEKVCLSGESYDWMGRRMSETDDNHFMIESKGLRIEYIYKPNGGLYTGYNVAYAAISAELCVCVDSDDYMPDEAVAAILKAWDGRDKHHQYCGVLGLDFNVVDKMPIGGFFPADLKSVFFHELRLRKLHTGDTKPVLRSDLMKAVAPMEGFEGEKNFNPIYLMLQVCDKLPLVVVNENFCWVEYQIGIDSMSQGIYRQYVNSPRSFAKMRLQEMTLQHNMFRDRFRSCVHYVASCMIARDGRWLAKSPKKILTLLASPFGVLWYCIIKYKNRKA